MELQNLVAADLYPGMWGAREGGRKGGREGERESREATLYAPLIHSIIFPHL
jgi:hypothetical protein